MEAPYLRYKPGGFFVGIPARDMTLEEAEKYGGVKRLVSTGLYTLVEAPKKKAIIPDEDKSLPGPEENKAA